MAVLKKIALLVEYEGTAYFGFQIQKNVPTIQGEIEKAILKVTGEQVRIHGAGRTDTGVHARGQVATFETQSALPPKTFIKALNFYLPEDIAIKNACEVRADFDPRRNAFSREYRYTILNHPVLLPLARKHAYHVPEKLNIDQMRQAADLLPGEHDFASFTNSEGATGNTARNVLSANIDRKGDYFITFDISANAFLTHQVRRTVGCLVKVGLEKMSLKEVEQLISQPKAGTAKPTAPPQGLCLQKVNYSDIEFSGK